MAFNAAKKEEEKKQGTSLSAVVKTIKKEERIQTLNQKGKCVTLKQGLGAGHGTVMGKRSVFLESLHRQPRTLAAGMGGGNKRTAPAERRDET